MREIAAHLASACLIGQWVAATSTYEALLDQFPGYGGVFQTTGSVTVATVGTGAATTQTLTYSLAGADVDGCLSRSTEDAVENACVISVNAGASCNDGADVGGPWWDTDLENPWAAALYSGWSGQTPPLVTGKDLLGHAVVVHDASGQKIACGVLHEDSDDGGESTEPPPEDDGGESTEPSAESSSSEPGSPGSHTTAGPVPSCLSASIAPYPGYSGNHVVSGIVKATTGGWGVFSAQSLSYVMTGTDPECREAADGVANSCGLHIHAGDSCEDASLVGGHLYMGGADPWMPVAYSSRGSVGRAIGSTWVVATGASAADVFGRTVVVHDRSGSRIGCGVLDTPAVPSSAHFSSVTWVSLLGAAVLAMS